ncbi:hypothetical protein BBJ29_004094 [Phytophthora kernoviae]|uniref:Uncharacterized protein n=1 Tax=Phytophthora kernoviae TaxID=325452 RepID=A0A3F2RLI8_9STRA|nr:hypothetical protein BBJ29_004094 [Phytophthora kernoviae]RLN58788.1 hypothetical protein BBP00_00006809 [Phytophthora kernoviae]
MFIKKYFIRLYDKIKLIPALAELVRTFSWDTVGASIVCGIDGLLYDILMKLALLLADELKDCQVAQAALTKYGLKKLKGVAAITPSVFAASPDLGLLWKNAMACEDPQVFRDVENLAKTVDIKLLGPVIGGVFAKRTQKMTAYRAEVERLTRLLQLPDENSNTENADTSNAANENIDTGNTEANIETMSIAGKKHPREEETNASATSKEGS